MNKWLRLCNKPGECVCDRELALLLETQHPVKLQKDIAFTHCVMTDPHESLKQEGAALSPTAKGQFFHLIKKMNFTGILSEDLLFGCVGT